jgi:hypothetical protein
MFLRDRRGIITIGHDGRRGVEKSRGNERPGE